MTVMRVVLGIMLAMSMTAANPIAQGTSSARPTPARENLGVVRGRVVFSDTSAPVSQARVSMEADSPRRALSATTDGQGNFAITSVPPGSYRMVITKEGHPSTPFPRRVNIASDSLRHDVEIRFHRGAVISGVVADASGQAVSGAIITALRTQYV